MQKLINVLAPVIIGGASIVGGGAYVYLNREADAGARKGKGTNKAATEAIAGALSGLIDSAMPSMPEVTGSNSVPSGRSVGL